MRASPLCPFCNSHRVATATETALLVHHECAACGKRWAEANVRGRSPERVRGAEERARGTAEEEKDRPHPLPKWSPP
jgi:hypothetical protein